MPPRRPRAGIARPQRHAALLVVALAALASGQLAQRAARAQDEGYQLTLSAAPEGPSAVRATITTDIPAPIEVVVTVTPYPADAAGDRIDALQRIRVANGGGSLVLSRAPKPLGPGEYLVHAALYPKWGLPEDADLPRHIRAPLEARAVVALPGAPSSGGSISGRILVRRKGGRKHHESFENAVVYLAGHPQPAPAQPAVVNQQNKQFHPRVLPVIRGQKVYFTNRDDIDHNVYSTEERQEFDLGRYPLGVHRVVSFDEPGFFKVYCNIHQKMILDVAVLENSYFDITAPDGSFRIDGVPPGEYALRVWHIYGGEYSAAIAVEAGSLGLGDIEITSTKVIRQITDHRNKHGRRYRSSLEGGAEFY